MKNRFSPKVISLTFFVLLLSHCSKNSVVSENQKVALAAPWNPAVGASVPSNITISDGWGPAFFVAPPLNLSTDGGWTDSIKVSRDGRRVYFAYSRRDGDQYLFHSNPVITGAARTIENTTLFLQIFRADLLVNGFEVSYSPVNLSNQLDLGAIAFNQSEDLMAIVNYSSGTPSQQIQLVGLVNGAWQQLGALAAPINGPANTCKDDNPFIIGNSTAGTFYWQSSRNDVLGTSCPATNGNSHYYMANVTNGVTSSPQLVPGLSTANSHDVEASFSEDKSKVYWVKNDSGIFGIYTADWTGSAYGNIRPIITFNGLTTAPWDGKLIDVGQPTVAELSEGYIMYFRCVVALSTDAGNNPNNRQFKICVMKKPK